MGMCNDAYPSLAYICRSAEQYQDTYFLYFDHVEQHISQLSTDGYLLVAGDLNAYFGGTYIMITSKQM